MISRRSILLGGILAPAMARAQVGPAWLGQRPPSKPLPSADSLIAEAKLGGVVGYAAMDEQSGQIIESKHADLALRPASTLKAVTSLYALDRLGADHRFRTRVMLSGDTLILAGGGDPVLSTDDLSLLAQQLVDKRTVSPKRFAVWGGALPAIDEIEPAQADHLAYNPALSGMILNFNRVHLGWRPSAGNPNLSVQARAETNSPPAYTVTARGAAQRELFTYAADERGEHWVVSSAALRQAGSRWLPVRKPELYAGDVFQTLCRAKGLVLSTPEILDTRPSGTELAFVESPPLEKILRDMMEYSTNLTAEVVGLHASGADNLAQSAARMELWLREQGVPGDYVFADHSGLSASSRINPSSMVKALAGPGRRALLSSYMKEATADDMRTNAKIRVAAKTGTLNFVSNLAGFAEDHSGRQIVFAIMCADETRRSATEGKDLPAGVISWTQRAKSLQLDLIGRWARPD